jgi:hypothetical protein
MRAFFPVLIVCVLIFAGCETSPPALPSVSAWEALPAGADAYFYVSAEENRELLSGFLEEGMGTRYFLENTRSLYGALLRSAAGGESPFVIAAGGNYSVGLVEFGLRRSEGWEEKAFELAGGGTVRYYRGGGGQEIAAPSSGLILMTQGGIEERLQSLYGVPVSPLRGDAQAALEGHSAGFYFPDGNNLDLLPAFPKGMALPLREALFFIDPASGERKGYELSGRLAFKNETDALAASVALRLLLSAFMGSQGFGFAEIRALLKVGLEKEVLVFSGVFFPRELGERFLSSVLPARPSSAPQGQK